ncbi:hypothetical protein D9M69_498430 [compost metagenome]
MTFSNGISLSFLAGWLTHSVFLVGMSIYKNARKRTEEPPQNDHDVMRQAFHFARAHGQHVDWYSWQIAWHAAMEHANESPPEPVPVFDIGQRVVVKKTAGFNRGAHGVVQFVEPAGERIWVLRDRATVPVYYHHGELEHEANDQKEKA